MKRRGGRRRKKVCVFCGTENNQIDYKEYINDFSANKERITAMAEKTDLGEEKKNLLMTILDQMDQ